MTGAYSACRLLDRRPGSIYDARMAAHHSALPRKLRASSQVDYRRLAQSLCQLSRELYSRGWAVGTSGNFSAVVSREPLRLAITHSGVDKGSITPSQIVLVDDDGKALSGSGRPSDEVLLHLAFVTSCEAGAVLHTHSIWSTISSEAYAPEGGLRLHGYEMLKGLEGVHTHDHSEWLPIVENSQDMPALAREVRETREQNPHSHGILLRRHGLYTWGKDLAQAKRHLEILEFLVEVTSILDFGFGNGKSQTRHPRSTGAIQNSKLSKI
jgi:methylthioribulose-1-phosphate dehydratase